MSDVLSQLEAERAVRDTIVMMHHAVDDEDWPSVRAYLNADFQLNGITPPIRGADTVLTFMRDLAAQSAGSKFQHILGNMTVTVSVDEAEATALQTVYRYRADELSSPLSKSGSRVAYRLKREYGAWKIVSFSIVRLWMEGEL